MVGELAAAVDPSLSQERELPVGAVSGGRCTTVTDSIVPTLFLLCDHTHKEDGCYIVLVLVLFGLEKSCVVRVMAGK